MKYVADLHAWRENCSKQDGTEGANRKLELCLDPGGECLGILEDETGDIYILLRVSGPLITVSGFKEFTNLRASNKNYISL